jgi:hypothetical protein
MTVVLTRRPAWQTAPCPPWCTTVHKDDDLPGDRHCLSTPGRGAIATSLRPPIDVLVPSGTAKVVPSVYVCLEADEPGTPARLVLCPDDFSYVPLTLDEAEQLVDALTEQIRSARKGAS